MDHENSPSYGCQQKLHGAPNSIDGIDINSVLSYQVNFKHSIQL